ncbi:hypothetical protein ACC817_00250 [Rhizobium ruizarguesonis]|uniref:hypothetical protein n=1 Tax=Rhizobium ruizarguesonis TaxID=2081791 RepID=UPI00102FEFC9|nr:hypothetical protein [Rhizobium ruizarguesonis]TAY62805.1 hypothetical protein ELH84_33060 [Rhizobium ruizarguesonis]
MASLAGNTRRFANRPTFADVLSSAHKEGSYEIMSFAVQTESALWAVSFFSEYGFDAAERSAIIEYARKMYHNEREISDAAISNVLTLSDGDRIICVRFTAKNRLTERVGVTTRTSHDDQRYGFALAPSSDVQVGSPKLV